MPTRPVKGGAHRAERRGAECILCVAMKNKRRHPLVDRHYGWKVDHGLAAKAGVDLATIEWLAPHIFILDLDDAGPPIYRLAGSEIQDFIGSNPRGKEFYGYWDIEARTMLERYFNVSAESHLAFRLSSIVMRSKSDAMEFETILIPVTDVDARKKCFIGISLALGDPSTKAKPPGHVQHLKSIAFVPGELPIGGHDG
jgi:hypothetical protein